MSNDTPAMSCPYCDARMPLRLGVVANQVFRIRCPSCGEVTRVKKVTRPVGRAVRGAEVRRSA